MENNDQPFYKDKKPNFLKEVLQWILVALLAFVVAIAIRAYVFEFVMVDGPSMENTLFTGQRLLVYKLGYEFSEPKKGDIIVFEFKEGTKSVIPFLDKVPIIKDIAPKKDEVDFIKRAIALPGDVVDIKDGAVYVNGVKLDEPYTVGETSPHPQMNYPVTVPPNKIFAVGDHRNMSRDSREIGFIDIEKIKGKAVFRLYPLKNIGTLK